MKIVYKIFIPFFCFACHATEPNLYICVPSNHELTPPDTVHIEQLADKALQRSSVKALESITKALRYSEDAALSGYYPHMHIATSKGISSSGTYRTTVDVEQLLLSFAGPIEEYKIAHQDTIIAQLQELLNKEAIQFELEQELLTWWLLERKKPTITSLHKVAIELLTNARHNYESGLLSNPRWFQEKADYTNRLTTVQQYQDDRYQNIFSIERSIESPLPNPINEISVEELLERSLSQAHMIPLDFCIQQAELHRKELRVKDAEIKQQDYYNNYYRRSYLPSVSLFASVVHGDSLSSLASNQLGSLDTNTDQSSPSSACSTSQTTVTCEGPSATYWFMGLRFSWDFDGFGRAFKSDAAQNFSSARMLEKQNLKHTIILDIQTVFTDLQKLLKDLEAAYVSLKAEENRYDASTREHTIGLLSDDKFIVAQNRWEDAIFAVNATKTSIAQKYRELLYKCGYPNEIEKL